MFSAQVKALVGDNEDLKLFVEDLVLYEQYSDTQFTSVLDLVCSYARDNEEIDWEGYNTDSEVEAIKQFITSL